MGFDSSAAYSSRDRTSFRNDDPATVIPVGPLGHRYLVELAGDRPLTHVHTSQPVEPLASLFRCDHLAGHRGQAEDTERGTSDFRRVGAVAEWDRCGLTGELDLSLA